MRCVAKPLHDSGFVMWELVTKNAKLSQFLVFFRRIVLHFSSSHRESEMVLCARESVLCATWSELVPAVYSIAPDVMHLRRVSGGAGTITIDNGLATQCSI